MMSDRIVFEKTDDNPQSTPVFWRCEDRASKNSEDGGGNTKAQDARVYKYLRSDYTQ